MFETEGLMMDPVTEELNQVLVVCDPHFVGAKGQGCTLQLEGCVVDSILWVGSWCTPKNKELKEKLKY